MSFQPTVGPRKTPQPAPSSSALEPGAVVAERYRIVRVLGEGGMGIVYEAEHVHMRKRVALKVLLPEFCRHSEVVARFEREAVAAARVTHPNVVTAVDSGRLDDGSLFLVLELVEGRDLRALVDDGPLPESRALALLRAIADGVAAAHDVAIIHRDLKPENVMIVATPEGGESVKVLDFGIAKLDSDSPGAQPLTQLGTIFGTPDYMAPEQARGEAATASSDVFALGVIFYEMLVGARPWKGESLPALLAERVMATTAPELPPEVAASVGETSLAVVRRTMAVSPLERLPTARALVELLDGTAASVAATERPPATEVGPSPAPSSPSWSEASPAALWARSARLRVAVAAVVALVVAGFVGRALLRPAAPEGDEVDRASSAQTAQPASASAAPWEPLPPPEPAASAAPRASASSEAPAASLSPASGPAAAASARPSTGKSAKSSSGAGTTKGSKRSTVGGIYIPPPKDWFK